MAHIKTITGVNQSEELVITKGFADLIVCVDAPFQYLSNERISVYVEQKDGTIDIARQVLLKDFILLGTFQEDTIQHGTFNGLEYMTVAKIELTEDSGFINLVDTESIKIKLTDLDSSTTYSLHSIESHFPTQEVNMYQRKTIASNQTEQEYFVRGMDLCSLEFHSSIEEIEFRMDNGATIKMTPFELQTESNSIDVIKYFNKKTASTGVGNVTFYEPIHILTDRVVFPLVGVDYLKIRKNTGQDIDLHMRIDQSDYNTNGHANLK